MIVSRVFVFSSVLNDFTLKDLSPCSGDDKIKICHCLVSVYKAGLIKSILINALTQKVIPLWCAGFEI